MDTKNSLEIKFFVDGQNIYNRLKDMNLKLHDVDWNLFFHAISDRINKDFAPETHFLRADWFRVSEVYHKHYPWKKLKKKYLGSFVPDKSSKYWSDLMRLPTDSEEFPESLRVIFDAQYAVDMAIRDKILKEFNKAEKSLKILASHYKSQGGFHNGERQDLIHLHFVGFLKLNYASRSAEEKGVDVAIATQMLASILDTSNLQHLPDKHDVIPDTNSDIIVLLSTDEDYLETLRVLKRMLVPVYVIFITSRPPSKNSHLAKYATILHYNKNSMNEFCIRKMDI